MLGQLFDKPGSEKGLTVKKAVQLQKDYKEKKSKTEPKVTGTTENTTQNGAKQTDTRRNKGTISYPARASQDRDYLSIKCIKYITPKRASGSGNTKFTGGGNTIQYGGAQKIKNKQTGSEAVIEGSGGLTFKFGKRGSERSKKAKKTLYTVNLPIPQQVSDNIGVTWGESSMNMMELAGLQIAQDFMESPQKALDQYNSALKNTNFSEYGIDKDVEDGMRAALSGTALNTLGANVTANQVLGRSSGKVLNDNKELIFEGVQLRTFPFNIQFSPRDSAEAAIVLEIIRNFKQSMSPKKGEGSGIGQQLFVSSPDVFMLQYKKGGRAHPFLNSFKVCALTSLAVNYTGAGTYATYSDSTPIKVTVDLSFKELEPIYNDDYAEVAEGVGY